MLALTDLPRLIAVLACILLAATFCACGGSDSQPASAPATADAADGSEPNAAGAPAAQDGRGASSTPAARQRTSWRPPKNAHSVIYVRSEHTVELRTEPGGGQLVDRIGKRTEFGSPSVFGVVRREGRWAGVTTPMLANEQLGWIKLDPKRLGAGWTKLSIVVDLSERNAELRRPGRTIRSFGVSIGAPGTDTPTGRFAVTDTFRGNLNSAYGCCALALSANQPTVPSGWFGGRRIAIHGTYGPIGVAASHGCIRAANPDVSALVAKVPLGTPVFIRA